MGDFETLRVDLGQRGYDILIGERLLTRAARHIKEALPVTRALIVSDETVARFYLHRLTNSLEAENIASRSIIIAPGEASKSLASFSHIMESLLEQKPDRNTVVIALGGGVVGDLAGFAASVLLRGVPYVQIPTSLLAQVDSSVGGKTGINSHYGKNFIGSFYQPRLVLADIATLSTLEPRHMMAGYAEILKYALINDPDFFEWLSEHGNAIVHGDIAALTYAVKQCCAAKAAIVAQDEKEQGMRALLNLGHTFAHALEAEIGYGGALLHGEAVALGMMMACDLSVRMKLCNPAVRERLLKHYNDVGLPVSVLDITPDWDVDALMEHFTRDKKAQDGKMTFILMRGIGDAFVTKGVDVALLRSVLMQHCTP